MNIYVVDIDGFEPPQGPQVFSKVPIVTFEPANLESIGNRDRLGI